MALAIAIGLCFSTLSLGEEGKFCRIFLLIEATHWLAGMGRMPHLPLCHGDYFDRSVMLTFDLTALRQLAGLNAIFANPAICNLPSIGGSLHISRLVTFRDNEFCFSHLTNTLSSFTFDK